MQNVTPDALIASRPYSGEADLIPILDLLSAATSTGPPGAYWHPGDAVWGMYQNTAFDPAREVRLWEGGPSYTP